MNKKTPHSKSGQAIIFLIFVVVLGLLIVIWNFDLHRVINAKMKIRNIGDSAALSAARWQGYTLNMIGELNLIQAAIMTDQIDLTVDPIEIPAEVDQLHELRARLSLIGPLTAFAAAQQAAFNNGAYHDTDLQGDLEDVASSVQVLANGGFSEPYDGAYQEYADLLYVISEGVAVASYTLDLGGHPLEQEAFYSAIAAAASGWWCSMYSYQNVLSYYQGYSTWEGQLGNYSGDTDFLNLKLSSFISVEEGDYGSLTTYMPATAIISTDDYVEELNNFYTDNEVMQENGDTDNLDVLYRAPDVSWHIFSSNWMKQWPTAEGSSEDSDDSFPIYSDIQARYNYMGAEAGFTVSGDIEKGIVSADDTDVTVDIEYKTKAKAFGYLELTEAPLDSELSSMYQDSTEGDYDVPPHYFGLVLPAFREVRLVHSDIGDSVMSGEFYRHVKYHLEPYLDDGPDALDSSCSYCRLLAIWETLDWEEGAAWLEYQYSLPDDENPCYTPSTGGGGGGGGGGGASGGS